VHRQLAAPCQMRWGMAAIWGSSHLTGETVLKPLAGLCETDEHMQLHAVEYNEESNL